MIESAATPEARATLVAYLASKLGVSPQALVGSMPFEIVAVKVGDKPLGAVLYTNMRDHSIEMSCAGEPGWLTRSNLRDLFAYPFKQLGMFTVLTMVTRHNKVARAFNEKLGFTELCVIPCGDKSLDTILYGMTRNQCSWIETDKHSQPLKLAASNGVQVHG